MTASYSHRQSAPLFLLPAGVGALLFAAALIAELPAIGRAALCAVGVVLVFLSSTLATLTVREEGGELAIRFGPLPLARKLVPYDSIRSVRRARSRLIDGWGIHWIPGRGWTWNLWGFDCVELELDGGTLRVGTDDPEGLERHLRERGRAARGSGAA